MLSRFPCPWPWELVCGRGPAGLRVRCVLAALATIVYSVTALAAVLAQTPHLAGVPHVAGAPHLASLVAAAAVHLLACLFSALMITGVLREVSWLVRPWLALTWLQVCAGALALLLAPLATAYAAAALHPLAIQFLIIMVRLYMVTVVGNYCALLQEERAECEQLAERRGEHQYTDV
ncbi:uncharacterized protein LOC126373219 [Pectinophora gossypiella]|uniref:uncharacterized protein LOC126373219 n=1 Tax=Pectinophora gossypiella TaxID=13191 RepID=UPI00214E85D7|nr:uncharacterized protein LOC126373219 [Pectinophora gossypiella]